MLGKLMKHDWKNVYKLNGIIVLAVLVTTVIGCLMLQMPFVTDLFSDSANVSDAQAVIVVLMGMAGIMVYILMIVGATYGVIIYQGAYFYKSMYSEQGYLTHTLPVKPHQLLVSKILVSGTWMFIVYATVILSVIALVCSGMAGISDGLALELELGDLKLAISVMMEEMGFQGVHMIVILILTALISPFMTMITLFGALTIGQISKKHKLLMGILSYFGITMVISIISSIVQTIIMVYYAFKDMEESVEYLVVTYDSVFLISCIVSVVLYVLSHRIIKKKLNLA